jgi:hypothetical protein
MEQNRRDEVLKEYGEVSSNFRLLTDIRFKLLAFLPIATASAVLLKAQSHGMIGLLLSLFGIATTIGFAIYNTRNDQLYDELVGRAAEIERTLGIPEGAFANRPKAWLTITLIGIKLKIDHRTGVGIIYASSIAIWLFGVYFSAIEIVRDIYLSTSLPVYASTGMTIWTYLVASTLALLSTYLGLKSIREQKDTRQKQMRKLAASAVEQLCSLELCVAAEDIKFISTCSELADIDVKKVKARANFYGRLDENTLRYYMPTEPKLSAMSSFVALLTDLPPRWILDCATSRREAI